MNPVVMNNSAHLGGIRQKSLDDQDKDDDEIRFDM